MSSKSETVRTRTVRIFDLDDYNKLLEGVQVAACMLTESHQVVDEASVLRRLSALTRGGPSDGNCCSCCGVGPFDTREQQTAHYKDHWHTHNLKRKLFGKPSLSLGQFSSRQDDNSSVSGSDSEGEDASKAPRNDLFAAATRHCKAFFTNQAGNVFCVYRCILHHRKEVLSTDGSGTAWVERCQRLAAPSAGTWAVLMVSGGHFAGGVFAGAAESVHKTLHAYVARRGQGQAQAARDSRGHAPRSAGASLRRRNQAHFIENVQETLASWTEHLKRCEFIFYRAVGSLNQSALFGKKTINRDDPRVRQLPFPTRKPTFKEVKRVHETLASLEVYESMELFQRALMLSSSKLPNKTTSVTSIESGKKTQKTSTNKPIDRAKSRERTPRELPIETTSSEDKGPCYIDSETPPDWIKTLSEQSSNGVITNSRKDLLNDCAISSPGSESETENMPEKIVKKEKKKEDKKEDKQVVKKTPPGPPKIPADVKKMWKLISDKEESSLATILEAWEGDVGVACNTQDPDDGNTALHKAAIAAKPDMVTQLLAAGGDPCVRNHLLQTPYAASPHHHARVAFRMFQADHPDKYNYAKSQIPGPVTPEQLEQEKERKAQQKRAKRQREKDKQLEKTKINKFLLLTDAQKVEAREGRCFLCGNPLPKMPFEYDVYKFCTVPCMQNHRNIRPLHKSD